MSIPWAQKQKGFTIVELLIVIVVIAILAAITIVAYNGIQQRAANAQTTQATKEYMKAMQLYYTDNGIYPPTNGCLGNGYKTNNCLSQNGTAACFGLGSSGIGTTVNSDLQTYLGNNLPMPSQQPSPCGGTTYFGIYTNGSGSSKNIYMMLLGNQTCPSLVVGKVLTARGYTTDTTNCVYTLVGS